MPPRRARPAPPPAPKPAPSKRPPVSKFAKELGLSAQEETEIKEAFEFFAHTDRNSDAEHSHDDEDEDDEDDVVGSNSRKRRKVPATKGKGKQKAREEEKVLPTDELRNALKYVRGFYCLGRIGPEGRCRLTRSCTERWGLSLIGMR